MQRLHDNVSENWQKFTTMVFNMFKNMAATDLVAAKSPTSRRLLCNLAGTDRGPCCDLCDRWKLSVTERLQSSCNVCVTEA